MVDKLLDFFPFLLLTTVRNMVKKINQIFAAQQIDLTGEQFAILNILSPDFNMGAEVSQQDIADFLDKGKSTILRGLDILERKHYVQRRPKAKDRRVNLVVLTELGTAILMQARAVDFQFVNQVSARFDQRDFQGFKRILQQINDACTE